MKKIRRPSGREVLLRIAKKGAKKAITYAEALDVALAWGWIDGQKRALDREAAHDTKRFIRHVGQRRARESRRSRRKHVGRFPKTREDGSESSHKSDECRLLVT